MFNFITYRSSVDGFCKAKPTRHFRDRYLKKFEGTYNITKERKLYEMLEKAILNINIWSFLPLPAILIDKKKKRRRETHSEF